MASCRRFSTLVVVDPTVVDYSHLISSVNVAANVLILDRAEDGITQITQALSDYGPVESLHILSHGSAGSLQLGSTFLSWQTLDRYAAALRSWAKTLAAGAEILLYGCEVAADSVGEWFVNQVKALTGAEIAASSSLTGNAALGGDWRLNVSTAPIQTPIVFSAAAIDTYPHVLPVLVSDDFRGSDVIDRSWKFGVGDTVGTIPPQNPFLTARGTTAPSGTGGLPGSPTGTALDAVGEGALRLTTNTPNQAAFVLFDTPILASNGLTITFEIFAYNGSGADGLSFFLLDGSFSPTEAGAFGGSLGYAQKIDSTVGPVAGLNGAFAGIGFDEFGNFSSATDTPGGITVRNGGIGQTPDSIAIRAGESTGYGYVGGTGTLVFEGGEGIDDPTATARDDARRTVKIDVTPEGRLSVRIDGNNDGDFLDPGESNPGLIDQEIAAINGVPLPTFFKFGFASGTGDFTNIHEVRNLVVSTLNNPPETSPFSQTVVPGSTVLLPGFSAVDPDVADGDSVSSYTITTLPAANQGLLFLGDPASGGTVISAGATLTPQQIQTVFFQAAPGFSGSTFTYTATDTRAASDDTPATVTLTPRTLDNNLLPNTAPSSVSLFANATALVPNLSGSDPDGTVNLYRVLTLPPANQGVLYLGDPIAGGTPISAGQNLTPAQIQQVYFQSSGGFSGSQFTYAAIDDLGAVDPTPATVDLNLRTVVNPVVCEVGERIRGTARNDSLDGGKDIDRLWGLQGDDRLRGFNCNDMLDGGQNNDKLAGGGARDLLMGRQNRDVVRGNGGDDVLNLGLGFDKGYGGKGNDVAQGRRGNDFIKGRGGNDDLYGGRGRDQVIGGANNDFLDGQQGDDFLKGSNGDDTQNGGLGADKHRGGRQSDRIVGRRGADTIWGGKAADTLIGGRGNDRIAGHTQDDVIVGSAGNDRIIGGNGSDRIRTGSGADLITYKSALHGVDRIADFDVEFDKFNLRPIFKKPGYGSSNRFDAYVRLGNSDNGAILRVDSNGDTAGGFVRLAFLRGVESSSLSASNFVV